MTKKYIEKRGGRRTGSGRKRKCEPTAVYNVSITIAHAELLKTWGGGDISAGLRWLIDAAEVLVRKVRYDSYGNP